VNDQELLAIIKSQEEAITELNSSILARDQMMREAIKEADDLHRTLSSTFLRMLATRKPRK
jgi:hypothetical protein